MGPWLKGSRTSEGVFTWTYGDKEQGEYDDENSRQGVHIRTSLDGKKFKVTYKDND